MRFVFWHHEVHGSLALEDLWAGTHGSAGGVARLRILFWLAARGHEVFVVGNVRVGALRGVTAMADPASVMGSRRRGANDEILVLNNPPCDDVWRRAQSYGQRPIVLWAGNAFSPVWVTRARRGCPARIVCVSEYHRDLYRIYPGFERVEVVYSGVDLDLLERARPNPEAAGAVVSASIPRKTKGFQNFLRAWPVIRQALPDARLRVLGSALMHDRDVEIGKTGVLEREIEEWFPEFFADYPASAERWGITLLGRRTLPQVYGEMKAAGAVVVNCGFVDSFETYCRAAIEAQAAGAPVVGAARGSLPEVLRDGVTASLVRTDDPRALAAAVVRFLRDYSDRGGATLARPATEFPAANYEVVARQWEAVARRAVTGERAPSRPRWAGDLLRRTGYGRARLRARDVIRSSRFEPFWLKAMSVVRPRI